MFKAIKQAEKKIIELNKLQLSLGKNREDEENTSYADSTQNYWRYVNPPANNYLFDYKVVKNPYNFEWSGDLLKGLKLEVSDELATIYSTNTNGGKDFYIIKEKAFGLNDDNLKLIIQTKVIPFINKLARATLKI